MDRERAKDYIKDQIENYLQSQGLPTDGKTCFHCLNPEHEDKNPSMCYFREAKAVHCFSCHAKYDIFDLIGMDYNLREFNEQFKKGCELYGITLDRDFSFNGREVKAVKRTEPAKATAPTQAKDYSKFIEASAQNRAEAVAYLESRGIDGTLAESFNIGLYKGYEDRQGEYQDESKRKWNALVIPISKSQLVVRNTAPTEELEDAKRHRYRKIGKAGLFGAELIDKAVSEGRPLIVTEGEMDALSVISVGGYAISPGSADDIKLVTEAMRARKNEKKPLPTLVLALDNDTAGKPAQAKLLRELQGLGCPCYGDLNLYGTAKDANEALQQDKESFIDTVLQLQSEEGIDEYIDYQDSAAAHIQEFINDIEKSKNIKPVTTGFPLLNKVMDGGLYEGLYILGAAPGVGKSAIALQIADHVAGSGTHVLYFALEMTRKQLMARSISRLTYTLARDGDQADKVTYLGKGTREIMIGSKWEERTKYNQGDQNEHIRKAIRAYEEPARYVHIHEGRNIGTKEIVEITENRIKRTGQKPLLIVDYLQIIKPEDTKAEIRANTDSAVIALKNLSTKYGLAILLISSMNRPSYKSTTGMEGYKESSGIEFNCDVALALQYKKAGQEGYNQEDEQNKDVRELVLRVSKNREGQSGVKICMDYMPKYNYMCESKNQDYMRSRENRAGYEDFMKRIGKK